MTAKTKRLAFLGGGLAALVLIILYSGGFLATGKVRPGHLEAPAASGPAPATAQAENTMITECYEAVGSVRPRSEATVEAQVPGRVLRVDARAGQTVARGQVLVVLEDRQLQAKMEQARQGLAAAKANLDRAQAEYQRVQGFAKAEAATPQNLEQAKAAFLAAQAGMRGAEKQVEEAQVGLGYTQVSAPATGQVVRRLVEPGDLAMPGKPLLLIQTLGGYRLEAQVREGLADQVSLGRKLEVVIPSLPSRCQGVVEEVSPAVDPLTRSFTVKVGLEGLPGLRAGLFGRLLVPVGQRPAVLAPKQALRRVGQLEMVSLKVADGWRLIYVRTGQEQDGKVEVFSGLKGGETLALEPVPAASAPVDGRHD